jgi:hypothetical protein
MRAATCPPALMKLLVEEERERTRPCSHRRSRLEAADLVFKRYGRELITEIAGDQAEGSPASMPPRSGSGAGVGDH